MDIIVSPSCRLTPFARTDIDSLTECLADEDIYRCTLRIPRPYTRADAERWFAILDEKKQQDQPTLNWAIRQGENLIGGIGLELATGQPHRAELGYWLAKPFWRQGIMSAVVAKVCEHAFETLGLVKITANVFSFNASSARVLKKCGFEQEGYLRKNILKDGEFIDSMVFGLLRM
jgi:[ribosomal protein S5]-alanine N-acetyltransferase